MSKKKNWRKRHGIVAGQGGDQMHKGASAGGPHARPSLQVVGPGSPGASAEPVAGVESQVAWLLAKGKVRDAIAVAKDLCKKKPGEASERELATAYCARIDELVRDRAYRDALELARVAAGRHAVGRNLVASRILDLELLTGSKDAWASTAKAALAGDAAAMSRLRRCLAVPELLTQIDSLPQDFPLCVQARALTAALTAVTSGPVSEDRVLLPEVPRSSPLADWKWLARAIHCFYLREDDFCRRYLAAISPESPPARGAAALLAILDGQAAVLDGKAGVLAQKLVRGEAGAAAKVALERLLQAFPEGTASQVGRASESLFVACRKERPDLVPVLQREVLIHSAACGIPFYNLLRNLASRLETDADFWVRLARACELAGMHHVAPLAWTAALERIGAAPQLAEQAALRVVILRHAASCAILCSNRNEMPLVDQIPKANRPDVRALVFPTQAVMPDADFRSRVEALLLPEFQFERLCLEAPLPSHFLNWYVWCEGTAPSDWKVLDRIAGLWEKAIPSDHAPLLLLANQAERRDAYTAALKHLDKARRLGAPIAEVDAARRRLVLFKALRHLKDGNSKATLADMEEFSDLPGASEGNGLIVADCVRWFVACEKGEMETAGKLKDRLDRALGIPQATTVLLECLNDRARRSLIPGELLKELSTRKAQVPQTVWQAMDRCLRITNEYRLKVFLPFAWKDPLIRFLSDSPPGIDADVLLPLGNLVMGHEEKGLLQVISHAGLASGRHTTWFLAMRAASLSSWKLQRRSLTCWRLVLWKMEQTGDEALRRMVEAYLRIAAFRGPPILRDAISFPAIQGSDEEFESVVRREASLPVNGIATKDFTDGPYAVPLQCECESCRRRRAGEAEKATRWGGRRRRDAWMTPDDDEVDLPDDIRDLACEPGDRVYLDNPDLEDGLDDEDYDDEDYDDEDYDDEDYDDEDYDDEDYDDEFDDDRGARSDDVLGRLPPVVLEELAKIVGRFLRPDGTLPAPGELMRLAPGPLRKIFEALEASGLTPEDVFGPAAKGTRRAGRVIRRRRK